jgi:hypothetical protein
MYGKRAYLCIGHSFVVENIAENSHCASALAHCLLWFSRFSIHRIAVIRQSKRRNRRQQKSRDAMSRL